MIENDYDDPTEVFLFILSHVPLFRVNVNQKKKHLFSFVSSIMMRMRTTYIFRRLMFYLDLFS